MLEKIHNFMQKKVSRKVSIIGILILAIFAIALLSLMIYVDYGFKKTSEFYDPKNGNRAYIVYTSTTDEQRMVNYARFHLAKNNSFTYIHFYSSMEDLPDISTVNPEYAFVPPNSKNRIMTFEYMPSGHMLLWDREISYYRELKY